MKERIFTWFNKHRTQYFDLCIFAFFLFVFLFGIISSSRVTLAVEQGPKYAPNVITYQGKLMESSAAVTTTKSFGFLIYDAVSSGNLLYTASGTLGSTSTVSITPTQGIFSVDLGGTGTNELSSSTFSGNTDLYLEVWVGDTKLSPRRRLTSAPFALNSQFLLGISPTTTSSGLYIPHSDAHGNFVFTGDPQSGLSGGVIYVNPGSADDEDMLLGIAVNGTDKFHVDEDGDVWINGTATVSSSLQVNDGLSVSGLTTMNTTTINADLTVKYGTDIALYVDRINSRVGVASSSPSFPLSVVGQSYFSATSTIQDISVLGGIVLGGVKRTSWPSAGVGDAVLAADNSFSGQNTFTNTTTIQNLVINSGIELGGVLRTSWPAGGGDVTAAGNNTFTGLNSFGATTTLATTTLNGQLNVDSGTFFVDAINNRVGVATSAPAFGFSVGERSYFGATSTFAGPTTIQGRTQNPYVLGTYTLPDSGKRVMVRGQYAYVLSNSNSSLDIVDVSDPTSPTFVSRISDGDGGAELSNASGISVVGNYAYVTAAVGGALEIIDISNPKQPTHAGKILNSTSVALSGASNVVVSGNYAYVTSFTSNALEIIDVSNPRSPRHVSRYVDGGILSGAESLYISGHYAYVVASNSNLMAVFDISEPENPKYITYINHGTGGANINYPTDIFVTGRYAIITSYTGSAIEIIDISNPKAPAHAGTILDGSSGAKLNNAMSVFAAGKNLYVSSYTSNALEVIDFSIPSAPRHVGSYSGFPLDGPKSIYVANNVAYIASGQNNTLTILDVSGATIDNATIDNATIGSLNVADNVDIQGGLSIKSGLNVGSNGLLVGGDVSLYSPTSTLTSTNTVRFANTARFFSSTSSTRSNIFIFDTESKFSHSASSTYLLSVRNNGLNAFSVASNGDVAASGTIFANSAAIGTPGSPGDLAERVDIAVDDTVEPGDVVIVDTNNTDTYRRSRMPYEQAVAGVISTNPSLVIGFGQTQNTAVMAMVGRVPIKVSTENGPIRRGDVLVTASSTGYAMRYDSSKDDDAKVVGIIGVALESLDAGSGKIMGLVRTGFVNSRHKTIADIQQELTLLGEAQSAQGASTNLNVVDTNGQLTFLSNDLDATGHSIFNIKRLSSKDGTWEVDEQGRFITRLITAGGEKSLYSLQSGETEFVFSGSAQLQSGMARVDFDATSKEIIDGEKPIKINITLTSEANGVYISGKEASGFVVKELQNGASNATFDYVVIASRKTQAVISAQNNNTPLQGQPLPESVPAPAPVSAPAENGGQEVAPAENPAPAEVPVVEVAPAPDGVPSSDIPAPPVDVVAPVAVSEESVTP